MDRRKVADWLARPQVGNAIIGVILVNALVLGLETSPSVNARVGGLLRFVDVVCLTIFVIEISLKLYAHGWRFFANGWNVFDFVVVGIALVPDTQSLSVLRSLRILRVLRVISSAPRLRRVVEALITALPGMAGVFLMIGIIFYIGAVMTTNLFGDRFPDWFGTIGLSAYSLFQIMTLESWSMGIVRPVMQDFPYAWAFFVPFIILTTFMVVNLLVGLIVNTMQEAAAEESGEETHAYRDEVLHRLARIEAELQAQKGNESGKI
ncbi:MAG: ion transporter [Marinibacterium sp.]